MKWAAAGPGRLRPTADNMRSGAVPRCFAEGVSMGYLLKECLANPGNYGGARTASQIKYLVFHYTGNDGDKAVNNAAYFQNNIVKASAHYFVDDACVYRSVPDLRVAWAVGGSKYPNAALTGGGTMYGKITNTNSLSIELCDTVRNGIYQASEATLENAAALGRELMEKYGIPLSNVYRHFDVTGKHCPSYLISARKWAEFKERLEEETVVRYQCLKDVPAAFQPTIKTLMDAGILLGDGSDPDGNGDVIDLSHDQVRTLVFVYRGGGFDEKLRKAGLKPVVG